MGIIKGEFLEVPMDIRKGVHKYTKFDIKLEKYKEYFNELFPIFDKVQKIDSMINEDEINVLFKGFDSLYLNIKIEPLNESLKI